ncbi:hypothetical protein FHW69_003512 [Luteibacter sp. Sphag1AF]|uniref:lysylphosphatidylglycerol synthase transmembrane domain-containing protein n=1 Tax=Luteibacter sp. Sphag1AF TaxID=2587031 RepID=UPI0016083DFA|nr:lysylphosphatidylglycerol synthase transmembrane domain-containing protein [Luteibacter sp. Sphag1AF]MBB3228867.1 hypothetical protein [Luteibacter sp. Sphag1AF]
MDNVLSRRRLAPLLRSSWLRLLVGLGLFSWLCVKSRVFSHIDRDIAGLHPAYAGVGVVLGLAVMGIRAVRWNVIMADVGRPLPTGELLRTYGAAFFLGIVSPGRVGELVRIWLAREHASSLPSSATSVVFDRIFDVVPTLVVAAAFGATVGSGNHGYVVIGVRVAFAVLALASVALLVWPRWFQLRVEKLAAKTLARLGRLAAGTAADHQVVALISRRTMFKAFVISVASQALIVAQTYVFCRAVSTDINPLVTYAIVTMATIVASLPLSIGGIGTREVAVASALTALGLSETQATGFSLLCLLNFLVVASASLIAFVGGQAGLSDVREALRDDRAARVASATPQEKSA